MKRLWGGILYLLALLGGLVVAIATGNASPSWVDYLAVLFLWSFIGALAMSYVGTAKDRQAEGVPVKLYWKKGGGVRKFLISFLPEFTPWYKCSNCGHSLLTRDMLPVVSYLVYKGRCRYCGVRYSSSTFKLELLGLLLGYLALPKLYVLVRNNLVEESSESYN